MNFTPNSDEAPYFNTEPAKPDYQSVIDAGVKIEGAVCVSCDHAGESHVEETDHLAREGAEALGGLGVVVGLFAPPLLLATVIGAAAGGILGELAHSGVKSKIEQQAFETIPFGGAGVIVAFPRSSADGIDAAVTRALKKAVGEADGKRVHALKRAMAQAEQKMHASAG
jgi:arylsulfatase